MQQSHSFEAVLALNRRRRNANIVNKLVQVPITFSVLSMMPNHFGVEIGGSPTYERLPSRGWRDLVVSSGTQNTTGRKSS